MKVRDIRIANLTAHQIDLKIGEEVVKIDVEDVNGEKFILRVGEVIKELGYYYGIKIIKKELTKIEDEDIEKLRLVAVKNDIIIVSYIAGKALKEQVDDLNIIGKTFIIGEVERDETGHIKYAKSLVPISLL